MRAFRGSALCLGIVLALGANAAGAAVLGSFATSLGVFAALAALFVIKGWPAHVPASALSTGAALLAAGGAAWLWRSGAVVRLVGIGPARAVATRRARHSPTSADLIELPAGLERVQLLAQMREHFVRLQDAWDRGDAAALNLLATPEMLNEFRLELPVFAGHSEPSRTEVVTLKAELLGFERLVQADLVSIEFSGLMRESAGQGAVPFRELWLLTRAGDPTAGWRLARHQALL